MGYERFNDFVETEHGALEKYCIYMSLTPFLVDKKQDCTSDGGTLRIKYVNFHKCSRKLIIK